MDEQKQTRGSDYIAHLQHLGRRATSKPSAKRYTRKRKHRSKREDA